MRQTYIPSISKNHFYVYKDAKMDISNENCKEIVLQKYVVYAVIYIRMWDKDWLAECKTK